MSIVRRKITTSSEKDWSQQDGPSAHQLQILERSLLYDNPRPTDQTLYWTRPFTDFWVVSIEHLRRVWHADGTFTPPETWSRPFGTCICSTCWDQSFSELVVIFLRTMLIEYPSVLSWFCLAYQSHIINTEFKNLAPFI